MKSGLLLIAIKQGLVAVVQTKNWTLYSYMLSLKLRCENLSNTFDRPQKHLLSSSLVYFDVLRFNKGEEGAQRSTK